MQLANLDMDVLRTLAVAMDLGGFAKAADRLGRSQSAVSLQMRKLEERVGRPLFRRQGRGLALTDAGVEWKDIQFGFGGSHEVSNPDAVTRLVGLTGITFTNVFNACATAASAIQQTADTIRLGKYDIGIAIGLDKHPRGAFTDDPAKLALPQWYAQNGQFVTTKFFGIKANYYLHKHGISEETLARVAPGLLIAGGGYDGVGIPDCVRQGNEAGRAIVDA